MRAITTTQRLSSSWKTKKMKYLREVLNLVKRYWVFISLYWQIQSTRQIFFQLAGDLFTFGKIKDIWGKVKEFLPKGLSKQTKKKHIEFQLLSSDKLSKLNFEIITILF